MPDQTIETAAPAFDASGAATGVSRPGRLTPEQHLPLTGPRERGPANAVHTRDQATELLRQLVVSPHATLTNADRERVRHAMRGMRLVADRLEEALDSNRRVDALNAATLGADAGIACAAVVGLIGLKS